jgi:radical SAM protein with 4Fe4S-binding SPASM domain
MLLPAPSGGGIATGMAEETEQPAPTAPEVRDYVGALESFVAAKDSARARHDLAYLFWECTLRCNLECRHCGSDCLRDASTKAVELPADRVCRELSAIARRYDPRGVTFAIIGGEPLIRRDIETVGAHAAALGYAWGVTTNAMLLKPARLASLKAAGLRTISVSLDGLEKEHDALRRRAGAFRTVSAAIRRLVDDPFYQRFDVICCVNALNIDSLEPFTDYLAALGVPQARFTPVFSRGRADANSGLMLTGAQLRRLLAFVAHQRQTRRDIAVTLSEEGYWGPNWECKVRDGFHYCGSGVGIGSILHDGAVTGCPSVSRRFVEGDLRESSFLDIWEHRFSRFRDGRRGLAAASCATCRHWDLCEGGGCHLFDPADASIETCSLKRIGEYWE